MTVPVETRELAAEKLAAAAGAISPAHGPVNSQYYRMTEGPSADPVPVPLTRQVEISMRALTVHRYLAWVSIIAVAACADRAPGADSPRDSTVPTAATSAPSDSGRTPGTAPAPAAGAQPNVPNSDASLPAAGRPACPRPVPVTYYARGGVANEFIVTFGEMNGANADAVTDSLSRRYGFTATHRYEGAFSGFSATLPLATLEAIRCERGVTRISQVVVGSIGTVPPPGASR